MRVNGNDTEIVAYCYDATGVTMPTTVGTDWYPVVIDSYTTAEYADLDAYLASEYGSELLSGCGCSAVVPLATAVARLADNDINITVHVKQGLYKRDSGGTNGLLVDKNGQAVYFTSGSNNYVLRFATANPGTLIPTDENDTVVGALIHNYGIGTHLANIPGAGDDIVIDGITYAVFEVSDGITLTPDPPAWT